IVVPYRDRGAHLRIFVPTLRAYFARDKVDRDIPYRVVIVEQEPSLPFNIGALRNIGFLLGRDDSDYTCFHDVDYLRFWADYQWSDDPACILWYGAESRPIDPSRPERGRTVHNMDKFWGGVILMPNLSFSQINGYSNQYWGWGYEDGELRRRFDTIGVQ